MNSDFEELLSIFNRYTKDLDLWVLANPENGAKVWRALAAFGAPQLGLNGRHIDLHDAGLLE